MNKNELSKFLVSVDTTIKEAMEKLSEKASKKILEDMNYPVVMKFPSGTQGKGVMFADSFASASSMLDALSALRQPFLIQE